MEFWGVMYHGIAHVYIYQHDFLHQLELQSVDTNTNCIIIVRTYYENNVRVSLQVSSRSASNVIISFFF